MHCRSPDHGLAVGSDSEDDIDVEDNEQVCVRPSDNDDCVTSATLPSTAIGGIDVCDGAKRQLFKGDDSLERSTSSGNIAPDCRGVAGLVRQRRGKDVPAPAISTNPVSTKNKRGAPVARATPRSLGMAPAVTQACAGEVLHVPAGNAKSNSFLLNFPNFCFRFEMARVRQTVIVPSNSFSLQ